MQRPRTEAIRTKSSPSKPNTKRLELMFMKHYAPNRCFYIKVAKLRTGVGSGGEEVGLGVRVDVNEELKEVFVKIQKKNIFFFGGGGSVGGRGRLGDQSGCERRIEVFVKIQKKKKFMGGSGGGRGRVGGSEWM